MLRPGSRSGATMNDVLAEVPAVVLLAGPQPPTAIFCECPLIERHSVAAPPKFTGNH